MLNTQKLKNFIFLSAITAGPYALLHCGKAPSGNAGSATVQAKEEEEDSDDFESEKSGSGKNSEANLVKRAEIYAATVQKPLKQYCGACHTSGTAPEMAQTDKLKALKALEEGKKINYESGDNSRVIQRLALDNHNCWQACDQDSKTMSEALKEYLAKVSEAKLLPPTETFKETGRVALTASTDAPGLPVPGVYVQYASMGTGLVAPMTVKTDDKDGIIDTYYSTATANQGEVLYTFNVTEAGTYAVWVKVKNTANARTLRISVNNAAPVVWTQTISAMSFSWDNFRPANSPVSTTFNLTAGTNTVKVLGGTANVKFNSVALTKIVANFQGGEVVGNVKLLKVPLETWAPGKNASIVAEISQMAENGAQIRNLRLITSAPLHIKDIRPLINGKYDSRWATFRTIDMDIPANTDGVILSRSAQILLSESFQSDKLSFTFGEVK